MHRPDLALLIAFASSVFSQVGFCYDESRWQPSYDYYHIDLGDFGGRQEVNHGGNRELHGGVEVKMPVPKDVMVDVINDLGIKLLAIHNERNENNIAISPYGALSVLAALSEGVQGDAVHEILHSAHIPKDRHVIRVGLRDIHRHLKSYFIPEEGFLAGLTLNLNNVSLRDEYEDVLRFYGFDYGSFNNALYPEPLTTQKPPEGSTLGITLGLSEGTTIGTVQEIVSLNTRLGGPTTETTSLQDTTTKAGTTLSLLSTLQGNDETTIEISTATTPVPAATTSSIITTVPTESTTLPNQETTIQDLLEPGGTSAEKGTKPATTTQQESTAETPTNTEGKSTANTETSVTESVSISSKISKVTAKVSAESSFEYSEVSTYILETSTANSTAGMSVTAEGLRTTLQEITTPEVTTVRLTTSASQDTTTETNTAVPTIFDTTTIFPAILSSETKMTEKTSNTQRTTRQISASIAASDQLPTTTTMHAGETTVSVQLPTMLVEETTVSIVEEKLVPVEETTAPIGETTVSIVEEKSVLDEETIASSREAKAHAGKTTGSVRLPTMLVEENTVSVEKTTLSIVEENPVPVEETTTSVGEITVHAGKTTVSVQLLTMTVEETTVSIVEENSVPDEKTTVSAKLPTMSAEENTVTVEETTVSAKETTVHDGNNIVSVKLSTIPVNETTVSLKEITVSSPPVTVANLDTTLVDKITTDEPDTTTQILQDITTMPVVEDTAVPFDTEMPLEGTDVTSDFIDSPDGNTPTQFLNQLSEDVETTTPFFFETTSDFQHMTTFNQDGFDDNYSYEANFPFNNSSAIDQVPPVYDDNAPNLVNNNLMADRPEGASFNRNLRRRARAVVDYVIARYYDDHYHHPYIAPPLRTLYPEQRHEPPQPPRYAPQPELPQYIPQSEPPRRNPYVPQQDPLTFAVYGKYRESGINFMKYDTVLPFFFVPNLKALALSFPLDSTKYYLLLLLPVEDNGVDQLVCDLRLHGNLRYIIDHLKLTHVVATIPSFMLKGYVTLTPLLQRLGIRRIFEPRQADFSPMTNVTDIYVTNIEQAVTVTIRNYLDPSAQHYKNFRQYSPVQFKADHPFLYFVIDSDLHVALMVGKVINPLNSRIR